MFEELCISSNAKLFRECVSKMVKMYSSLHQPFHHYISSHLTFLIFKEPVKMSNFLVQNFPHVFEEKNNVSRDNHVVEVRKSHSLS